MVSNLIAHQWSCPICSETKMSLATMDTMDAERQAEYALLSHVRTTNGGGHGIGGRYPPDFDPDDVPDFIEIESENGDSRQELNAVR